MATPPAMSASDPVEFRHLPFLGVDFASLLAQQVVDLMVSMSDRLETSIVEVGPGEGDLAADLLAAMDGLAPQLLSRCELVLVERSPVLRQRQQQRLQSQSNVAVRWCCSRTRRLPRAWRRSGP